MKRNGSCFLSMVERISLRPGIWDPYVYREKKQTETLAYFASVQPLKAAATPRHAFKFAPLEYRHIGRGHFPAFILESAAGGLQSCCRGIGEGALLFGTMRAYLGNVVVTPRAEWIGEQSPFFFAVKSEFVQVVPKDGLTYFWWAYLQTHSFLHSLPIGSGGTRPRLHASSLAQTPIEVPTREVREALHAQIAAFAVSLWSQYLSTERMLENTIGN
jgi:hypothetical protein